MMTHSKFRLHGHMPSPFPDVFLFLYFTIFPVILYYSQSFPALTLAFLVRSMKEFGEPTCKSLIMDPAPIS
jgi:hypothetical protein